MNKYQIYDRINLLFKCLQYSSSKTAFLSTGERIIVNQEIGQLLIKFDYPQASYNSVSEKIESKIKQMEHLMHVYNFLTLNEFPYGIEIN